jgi:hypothetical protein
MQEKVMQNMFRLSPVVALLLGACTTVPSGPSMLVMPGSNKSFDQFRSDDAMCRQYALGQVGGTTPNQAAVDSGVRSAAVGTVLGAAAGAAIGGERGAAAGAGTGLLVGGMAGTGAGEASSYGTQKRYDYAYVQCMYAQGHSVPVSGRAVMPPRRSSHQLPPSQESFPPGAFPPLPPGMPPPPPPDAQLH